MRRLRDGGGRRRLPRLSRRALPPFGEAFEDDDEVAILHAPAEAGWVAASDAMVDLRATLAAAWSAGAIGLEGCEALARALKRLPFPERSHARLVREAAAMPGLGREAVEWLRHHRVAQKRRDAEELLARIGLISPDRRAPGFRFIRSLAWENFLAAQPEGEEQREGVLQELAVSDPAAWRELRLMAEGHPGPPGHGVPDAALLEDFRRRHGLWRRSALEAWLAAHDLDEAGLHRLLAREAAIREGLRRPPAPATLGAMLDALRLSGRYAALRARLAGREEEDRDMAGEAVLDAALRWWFETRAERPPPPPGGEEAEARAHGFPDADRFRAAIWREYRMALTMRRDGVEASPPQGGG
ncbi:TfuA domain-containing protein [Roseomonas gilardii subsp. gilardii]|uniref:TfuA-like protein n=1 Tax=Roseomonas gilardii TaxID=257708 RepID=UPI001FF7D884|nr:TfuA-like protein [Roseomonas gilardii]UPG73906.1 TfuA domain-containing protein [Roseomonas gilardii subsp. gilardii]